MRRLESFRVLFAIAVAANVILSAFLVVSRADSRCPEQPVAPAAADDAKLAVALVKGLRRAVARYEMLPLVRDNPESAANLAHGYLLGFIDTVNVAAPRIAGEIASATESALCDEQVSAGQKLLLLQLAEAQRAFASRKGLECVIAAHSGAKLEENIVLWTALQAWSLAELPATPALRELQQRARDERTQHALSALEQPLASRDPQTTQSGSE